MNPIMIRYLLAIILLVFLPKLIFAEGFEYRGFKQGMSINEAEAHANFLGGDLTLRKGFSSPDAVVKGYLFSMNNDYKNTLFLDFCNTNKKGLFSVYYTADGGFFKYVNIIENFKKNGFKIIEAQTWSYFAQSGTEYALMSIWLNNDIDEWNIKVVLHGHEDQDIVNIQVTYGMEWKRYCKQ